MKLISFFIVFIPAVSMAQWKHPLAFFDTKEVTMLKSGIRKKGLLQQSFEELKKHVDPLLDKDIDVPFPKDPAGGYTHDQHKSNYTLMFESGTLYQLTGDKRYAELVRKMFLKYSKLNPTLKNHPQATSSSPGRLFWQALNDANWLVYAGLSYDCIHDYLSAEDRNIIEAGAFKPLVDYFTGDQKKWFDLIHNHAVWACAGVGIVGIATDNEDYLQMALKGTAKDGRAGFLAHLDQLFSPDGFYHEGPYYTRYAILPFYLFANALSHARPELDIYHYRNSILRKALEALLQQTNTDGSFFSYNDALKDKTYVSNEVVNAVDLAWQFYGANDSWLCVAQKQNRVILSQGGMAISNRLSVTGKPLYFPYATASYTDGAASELGGLTVLRSGKKDNLTSLVFKYTGHGLSHGHYDKLNIQLFDKGYEILQDYGAVRYINIEQKWGGRYLKETNSYAQQTIAHNTVTVDEKSHYGGDEKTSQSQHAQLLFSNLSNPDCLVVAASDDKAYAGISMQRMEMLVRDSQTDKKFVFDFFDIISDSLHQYDLPFNYQGTLMKTNFAYHSFNDTMTTMGNSNGYQHLWKQAYASPANPFTQMTFLNHNTFYTISTLSSNNADVYFTQTGANDPDFNLRREPSMILRTKGRRQTYFTVIEIHGDFSPISEVARQSYPGVRSIKAIPAGPEFLAFEVMENENTWIIVKCVTDLGNASDHTFTFEGKTFNWKGPFGVFKNGVKYN